MARAMSAVVLQLTQLDVIEEEGLRRYVELARDLRKHLSLELHSSAAEQHAALRVTPMVGESKKSSQAEARRVLWAMRRAAAADSYSSAQITGAFKIVQNNWLKPKPAARRKQFHRSDERRAS